MSDPGEIKIEIAKILNARMRIEGYQHHISALSASIEEEKELILAGEKRITNNLSAGTYLLRIDGVLYCLVVDNKMHCGIDYIKCLGLYND